MTCGQIMARLFFTLLIKRENQKRKIEAGRALEKPSASAVKLTGTDAFA